MISIPDDLLERVDSAATERATTRSGLLRDAVERELDRPTSARIRRALDDGRRLFADAGSFESAELLREARDQSGGPDSR